MHIPFTNKYSQLHNKFYFHNLIADLKIYILDAQILTFIIILVLLLKPPFLNNKDLHFSINLTL